MRRGLLIALLSLGVIAGFGSAFARWQYGYGWGWGHHGHGYGRAAFDRHVAQVCVDAARQAMAQPPAQSAPVTPP